MNNKTCLHLVSSQENHGQCVAFYTQVLLQIPIALLHKTMNGTCLSIILSEYLPNFAGNIQGQQLILNYKDYSLEICNTVKNFIHPS